MAIVTALAQAGFDTRRGIEATGGDLAFYLELVADFQHDYLDRVGQLRRDTDSAALACLAHDLKSVLRMLGDARIAEMAQGWEVALRKGDEATEQQRSICDALDGVSRALAGAG